MGAVRNISRGVVLNGFLTSVPIAFALYIGNVYNLPPKRVENIRSNGAVQYREEIGQKCKRPY